MTCGFYLGRMLLTLSLRHVVLCKINVCSANCITLEVSVIFNLFAQTFLFKQPSLNRDIKRFQSRKEKIS